MIKNRNIAPDAAIDGTKILGSTVTGNVYYVAAVTDPIYSFWQSRVPESKLKTTATLAADAATTNANDWVIFSGNSGHAITSMLTITKNRIHFQGATAREVGIGMGQRSRITMGDSTVSGDIALMQNTGIGNTFANLKFDSSSTVAASIFGVAEGGEYAIYDNCEFYKSTDLDVTTAAEVLNNGDSAQWINCYIGSTANIVADNVIRPCMSLTATLSGKKCRDNYMDGCVLARKAGGTEATFIYGANATDVERMFTIKNTTFFNNPLSAATPAVAVSFGAAQTEGAVYLDSNCAIVDVTVMATTGQNIFTLAPSTATYATSGKSAQS